MKQLGVLTSYGFVHPSSRYVGKFWTAFTTWVGYKMAQEYDEVYHRSRRFGNFWNYPADIRRMIDNNDARYAFRWLGVDYLARADETA